MGIFFARLLKFALLISFYFSLLPSFSCTPCMHVCFIVYSFFSLFWFVSFPFRQTIFADTRASAFVKIWITCLERICLQYSCTSSLRFPPFLSLSISFIHIFMLFVVSQMQAIASYFAFSSTVKYEFCCSVCLCFCSFSLSLHPWSMFS